MGISFAPKTAAPEAVTPLSAVAVATAVDATAEVSSPKRKGNTRPLPLPFDLHQCGRLRVGHMLTVFGISASEFYKRLKDGTIPPHDGRDPRPYWEASTILKCKENGGGAQ